MELNDNSRTDLAQKIIVGLERISEAFKTLLWEKAKVHGVSPIQIQILLFIANHKPGLCNVSQLAKEFNVTKPTVSDAVKVLGNKGFVIKTDSSTDNRSYTLHPSAIGDKLIKDLTSYSGPFMQGLDQLGDAGLQSLYTTLTQLIYSLNRNGVLTVQRTCFGCKFYERKQEGHHCHLLQTSLIDTEIRLDCPEYEEKLSGGD